MQRHPAALLAGLGSAQLVAWGTLYYAIAVLGQPMRSELGLTEPELFGVFTWSLALSGLLARAAGKLVDHMGGRFVLVASCGFGACGFVLLAGATTRLGFVAAWTLHGIAMALGLYETCFATLAQVAPANYRRSVTAVTLIGGLASTVAWPATHYLLREMTWRGTCVAYAGALFASAAVYLAVLPAHHRRSSLAPACVDTPAPPAQLRAAGLTLAAALAGAAFIAGALSAHLVDTLTARTMSREQAVWLASCVGALQVAGRLVEGLFAHRNTALRVGFWTFGMLAISTVLLLCSGVAPWLAVLFVAMYGISNGLLTVTKATIPVELLGFDNVGARLGAFSAPSLLTRAAAPLGFAFLTSRLGLTHALLTLSLIGIGAFGAYFHATKMVLSFKRA
jgi:MFS family permease